MARSVVGVGVTDKAEVGVERAEADRPQAPGGRFTCPRCGAALATGADLRRVRHVLLRCTCGAFQRVSLADAA
jgi:predicted RNA-binding Zn-ribbon protein involved in translation (DUF1610 family)